MNRVPLFAFLIACTTLGCSLEVGDERSSEPAGTSADELRRFEDFDVAFTDCVESIGVTLASTETVAALVPAPFIPVGTGTPVTPLVVRTSSCRGIAVDGERPQSGSIVQIGAVIVPPDGTGDINNYVLQYYSDDRRLVDALERAGLEAADAHVAYRLATEGAETSLDVAVRVHGRVPVHISGTVVPVSTPAGSFLANWWVATRRGPLKLSTNVPVIAIGSAALVLETRAKGELAELFGATSVSFPILEQFNAFAAAEMHVSRSD